jgi:hypothetical protein
MKQFRKSIMRSCKDIARYVIQPCNLPLELCEIITRYLDPIDLDMICAKMVYWEVIEQCFSSTQTGQCLQSRSEWVIQITDLVLEYLTVLDQQPKQPFKQNTTYHAIYVNGYVEGCLDTFIRGHGRNMCYVIHGLDCGPFARYFGDSTDVEDLREYGTRYNGRWHGEYIQFMSRGKLQSRGTYNNGHKLGVWIEFDKWRKYYAIDYGNGKGLTFRAQLPGRTGRWSWCAKTVDVDMQHIVSVLDMLKELTSTR